VTIFLVRHGETAHNAARIFQRPDIALSDRGHMQAERLAYRLEREDIVTILSSDMVRAAMTAEHLAVRIGRRVMYESLLHERNFGDIRGRRHDDFDFDPFGEDYTPPNGESWEGFHARVDRAWARVREVAAAANGNVAVFTHGLVCRSLAARHLTLPDGVGVPERWENASVTIIESTPPWRVPLLNCCAHLEDLSPSPSTSLA
jgi:probable phosphoglycerate mutase